MAKRLSNQAVLDWVLACRKESEEASTAIRDMQDRAWSLYFNRWDFSKKEDWQTKISLPKFAMGIDQAVSLMKDSLASASRLFTIEVSTDDPMDHAVAAFVSDIMHVLLRRCGLDHVSGNPVGVETMISDAVRVGLITNLMPLKVGWRRRALEELAPKVLRSQRDIHDDQGNLLGVTFDERIEVQPVDRIDSWLNVSVPNPSRLYLDPTGRGLYRIQESYRDLADLLEDGKDVYSKSAMQELLTEGPTRDPEEDRHQENTQVFQAINGYRKQVKVTEYWGNLIDTETGKLAARNMVVMIANDKHVLRVDRNPFYDGDNPFVIANMIRVPYTVYGKLLLQHTDSIQTYINEFLCILVDALKFSVLKPLAVDVMLLDDLNDLIEGLFPGKTFKVRGPNAVSQIDIRGPGPEASNLLAILDQEHQNNSGMTEFLAGFPTSRGRATATETQIKTQQSAGFFSGIMIDVNNLGITPLFEKCYSRLMQYMDDWTDPAIQSIAAKYGVDTRLLDPMNRYQLLKRPFKFHAAGLNASIRRSEMLEKVLRLMEVLGNRPEFLAKVNGDKLFERIIEAFDMRDLIAQQGTAPAVIGPQGMPMPGMPGMPQGGGPPMDPQQLDRLVGMLSGGDTQLDRLSQGRVRP